MDRLENPQPQPSLTRPQQKKENRGLAFLKIGIIEIFFVVIVLVIFFGVMNYFNILSISSLWPNQLGFLPHKDVSNGTSQQSKQFNNITTAPTVSLTQQAKETLTSFLPTILTTSLLTQFPSDITLIQEKENNTFSSPLKQGAGKITLTVSSEGKQIYELLLFFPYATTDSAKVELAKELIPQFFLITPKGEWGCKRLPSNSNYCENFWEDENGARRGIGIQEPNLIKNQKQLFLFYCEHRKESNIYSWKSCTKEFLQTGVQ